mgnify:CR=1 FL=1
MDNKEPRKMLGESTGQFVKRRKTWRKKRKKEMWGTNTQFYNNVEKPGTIPPGMITDNHNINLSSFMEAGYKKSRKRRKSIKKKKKKKKRKTKRRRKRKTRRRRR